MKAKQLTRQGEQDDPIHHQHGPEDGHVEDGEEGAGEGEERGARGRHPELELGQAADEGAELLVLLGGQRRARAVAVLERLVLRQRRVELGLQEGQEQVEQVDAEGVADYAGGLAMAFVSRTLFPPVSPFFQFLLTLLSSIARRETYRCTSLPPARCAGRTGIAGRRCRSNGRLRRGWIYRGRLDIAVQMQTSSVSDCVFKTYFPQARGPALEAMAGNTHPRELGRLRRHG